MKKWLDEATRRAEISPKMKEREAIKWCIAFSQIDLEAISRDDLIELIEDYDRLVADPNDSPYLPLPRAIERQDGSFDVEDIESEENEERLRTIFKQYQQSAHEILKRLSDSSGFDVTIDEQEMKISFVIDQKGRIRASRSGQLGFSFCFANALMNFFQGHKYTDRIARCQEPSCNKLSPVFSSRGKTYCSHECNMKARNKNKRTDNPSLERRKESLKGRFYYWKKVHDEERVRKKLRHYLAKNQYHEHEIIPPVRKFLNRG